MPVRLSVPDKIPEENTRKKELFILGSGSVHAHLAVLVMAL